MSLPTITSGRPSPVTSPITLLGRAPVPGWEELEASLRENHQFSRSSAAPVPGKTWNHP